MAWTVVGRFLALVAGRQDGCGPDREVVDATLDSDLLDCSPRRAARTAPAVEGTPCKNDNRG